MRRPILLTVLPLLLTSVVRAAPILDTPPDQLARDVLGNLPGSAAVGVLRHGAEAYGSAGPAGPDAAFEIGSISKVFTGLLVAQAVEHGDLALDDKLGALLPARLPSPVAAITLRQLLTHTACLTEFPGDLKLGPDLTRPFPAYSRAKLWAALARTRLPQAAPCEPRYSNTGFAVLGELLAQRYNKPWATLVRERITQPLGMDNTFVLATAGSRKLAPGYLQQRPAAHWNSYVFNSAGGLYSTTADMLRFSGAMLAGRNGPLGAAAERVLQPLGRYGGDQIGYAVFMRGPEGHRTYSHNGRTGGYASNWTIAPKTGDALIVLAGNADARPDQLLHALYEERYPLPPAQAGVTATPPSQLAGVYRAAGNMSFTFVEQDGRLYGRLTGQPFSPLTPYATDSYALPDAGAEFAFIREGGRITSVVLRQRGSETPARRTDQAPPPSAWQADVTQDAYGGNYHGADAKGKPVHLTVQAQAAQLSVALAGGAPPLHLFPDPSHPGRYMADTRPLALTFERNADGAATALLLEQKGKTVRAIRAATPLPPLDAVPIYLRGSMNDWGAVTRLAPAGNSAYSVTVPLAAGSHVFKVASEDWKTVDLGSTGMDASVGDSAPHVVGIAGENMTLSVQQAGDYCFTLSAANGRLTLSVRRL
ncbi:hypothetical protein GCM10027277_45600 [Pseudoduganella ginsengisoli]|uniref:Beta-lactamase n=1 Tax=Pseudoduganella ginsengisoli TaxID=1462440 RepID=A0A6L6Q2J2_9BURK|nr:serine hydrolase [Pseudoduganella ginsengisoli]MTW03639.1 serine hydrolase [Pseudoduganella ginsengisoli]